MFPIVADGSTGWFDDCPHSVNAKELEFKLQLVACEGNNLKVEL